MAWHWIDYAIIGIIALSVITGLFRGFIKELIALCVWIAAIWLAFNYSSKLHPWIAPYVHDKTAQAAVAFIAILLAVIIVGGLFNAMLSFILRRSGLSGTDRLLGMGFGFVRGVFIVALIMVVFKMTSLPHQDYTAQSRLYGKFEPLVNKLSLYMPSVLDQMSALENSQTTKKVPIHLDMRDIKPAF